LAGIALGSSAREIVERVVASQPFLSRHPWVHSTLLPTVLPLMGPRLEQVVPMARAMMCSFIARVPSMLVLMPSLLTSLFAEGEAQQPEEVQPPQAEEQSPHAEEQPQAAVPQEEIKQVEPQPQAELQSQQAVAQPTKKIRPQASFLRDISLPDGTKVTSNTEITKKWAMRNLAKEPWPASTRLLCVSGDNSPITSIRQEEDGLYILQATAKTPAKPGRFTLFFRLAHGDQNVLFGDRVWVDVVVEAEEVKAEQQQQQQQQQPEAQVQAPAEVAASEAAEVAPVQPADTGVKRPVPNCMYEKEIWNLQDMGFCVQDPFLAADLLRHARGDVQKVIEWFLTGKM